MKPPAYKTGLVGAPPWEVCLLCGYPVWVRWIAQYTMLCGRCLREIRGG